jgi:hypothetical protein
MSRFHDDNPRHEPTDTSEKTDHVAPAEAEGGGETTTAAARMIQRNYRGYRERRQMRGMGLDASSRWAEVCLESFPPVYLQYLVTRSSSDHLM